ncbi:MarR family winged helix-turn-helix transcriptional regulator [Virgibacillus sp. MG-45]
MMTENSDRVLELIRASEQFSNEMIIRWSKSFPKKVGISPILVLAEIEKHGPQKQSTLAKELGYTPGALTNIANRLIKERLAIRMNDPDDRRVVRLSITEKGIDLLKEAKQKGQEIRQEVFAGLTEEELHWFLRIHQKLLNKLMK